MIQGLEKLQLNAEQKRNLRAAEKHYKKNGRISFQVFSYENETLSVKIWQSENPEKKYLTKNELIACAKEIFKPFISETVTVHVHPIVFRLNDLVNLTIDDIERGMNEHGLKPKDLVKLLNIDRSTISIILLEGRSMTKSNKAMFYYLFKFLKERNSFLRYKEGIASEIENVQEDEIGYMQDSDQ